MSKFERFVNAGGGLLGVLGMMVMFAAALLLLLPQPAEASPCVGYESFAVALIRVPEEMPDFNSTPIPEPSYVLRFVEVGPYCTEAEAETVRQSLHKTGFPYGHLRNDPPQFFPPVFSMVDTHITFDPAVQPKSNDPYRGEGAGFGRKAE